ncbi:MAG: SDR family oxidoreductase [Clostridia bacterium]|nr:SDR family oxidoreductase [Clostridia bacterium]
MKALVTGAARGIGRAAALLFKEQGYEVFGLYEKSEYEARELEQAGVRMIKCDVSDERAVREAAKLTGDIDVLVNNAGVSLRKLFQDVTPEEEKRLYGVNLFGALNCARAFLKGMINSKYGVIINVSSVFGANGGSMEADYSASKAALIGFTKALAKETGPSGVRVNCVTPGIIDTDMNASLSVEDVRDIVETIPLESLGKPEQVAEVIAFLASEKADYITGAVISVDGGWQG